MYKVQSTVSCPEYPHNWYVLKFGHHGGITRVWNLAPYWILETLFETFNIDRIRISRRIVDMLKLRSPDSPVQELCICLDSVICMSCFRPWWLFLLHFRSYGDESFTEDHSSTHRWQGIQQSNGDHRGTVFPMECLMCLQTDVPGFSLRFSLSLQ